MVAVSTTLPVSSTTATFTPVRMPGSSPMVTRGPAGAASSSAFRLRANTLMASVSALLRSAPISSDSRCMKLFTRQVQRTVSISQRSAGRFMSLMLKRLAMRISHGLCGASQVGFSSSLSRRSCTFSISSRRPRNTASARCEGMVLMDSE